MKFSLAHIDQWLAKSGRQQQAVAAEKWLATLGGCLAIFCIAALSFKVTDSTGAAAIVPSMGAATVLLFAVPHGPLSQPWALFIGNTASAFVGVSCALLIDHVLLAAALAVGLAIGAMHLTRSIHPPGGATALAAVIGGDAVADLGYWYVVAPTLLNCCIIFTFAIVFNGLFPWRRYPLSLMRFKPHVSTQILPNKDALENSLRAFNIRLSAEQLLPILERAMDIQQAHLHIELGGVYSNDQPGANWAVRKIIDEHPHSDPQKDMVIYQVLEGAGKRRSESCRRYEFAHWAKKRLTPAKSHVSNDSSAKQI